MAIRPELNLRLPNSPGALVRVCRTLADERVNILAVSLEGGGSLRLVVDNHTRALGVLRQQHHQVTERQVLVIGAPHAPGGLAPALQLVANAGINVEYAYSGAGDAAGSASVVIGVEDAQRAAFAAGV
jgi:hypothetical protein